MDGITGCYSPGDKDLVRKIFLAAGALQLASRSDNPCDKTLEDINAKVGALLGVDRVCYNTPENVPADLAPACPHPKGQADGRRPPPLPLWPTFPPSTSRSAHD